MNPTIKATVTACPSLSLKVNVGDRHRIMNSNIRRGSLWVRPQKKHYRVHITGEVDSLLYHFLKGRFGTNVGEDQGRKYWHVDNIEDVQIVIRYFGGRIGLRPKFRFWPKAPSGNDII